MHHNLFLTALAVMLPAALASADYIAGTGFENEGAPGTGFANYDHGDGYPAIEELNNLLGDTLIESTGASTTAGDLGFVAEYERVPELLSHIFTENYEGTYPDDPPVVGIVNGMGPDAGATFTQSSVNLNNTQGYKGSEVWGILRLTFDPVDLSGYETVTCSLDAYFRSTGWEWNATRGLDRLTIYLETNEGDVSLFNTAGSDIDGQNLEGKWSNGLSFQLPDTVTTATLVIEFCNDSEFEQMYVDNIAFNGTSIPEPATMIILGAGFFGVCARRKRRTAR
jgi:hypothetical protein